MASRIFSPECRGSSSKPGNARTQLNKSVKRTVRGSTSGCASASAIAMSRESVHLSAMAVPSAGFLRIVDRVLGNFHREIGILDDGLAGQARHRREPPHTSEQVFLVLGRVRQRVVPLA